MDISLLEERRQVTFDWHIAQVIKWLKFDNGRMLDSVLVYASVEARCAIERYLFELLILLEHPANLTQEQERKCRSKEGMLKVMKDIEPQYMKRAIFTNLISSVASVWPKVVIIDFKFLNRMWHSLSEYCHKQLRPEESFDSENRVFQKKGFAEIRDLVDRFMKWEYAAAFGIVDKSSIPPEVWDVYEKYAKDEIDEREAKTMLDLMEPVLRTRPR